jgi:hypothetical protein
LALTFPQIQVCGSLDSGATAAAAAAELRSFIYAKRSGGLKSEVQHLIA